MKRPFRRRPAGLAVGAIVVLTAAAATSLYLGTEPVSPSNAPISEAEVSDTSFPAADPHPGRPDRVRYGDADAVTSFETVITAGSLTALPANGDPDQGSFSPVFDWPLIGIHSVLTPDGRVLSYGTTTAGYKSGYFSYDLWDPQLGFGDSSHMLLPNNTAVDLFCNAQLLLPSGNIEMWGGDVTDLSTGRSSLVGNDDSNLFNPLDNSLIRTGKMHRKRWYATATTMPTGEVYLQGGTNGTSDSGGKDYPELRTATGQFRLLTGASTYYINALYPRNFLAPDGQVFGLHYSQMYRVDPTGPGTITRVGKFTTTNIGASSASVMFAPGKILQVGGGLDASLASLEAHVVDIGPLLPTITTIPRPTYRRHWGNATVLPDGRVFLSGGSTADNLATNGVAYTSELYDPQTNTWSKGATAQRMRLYHSSAVLLHDATVLTLGGGALGPERNLNGEIYYPSYLFKADGTPAPRPVIDSMPMTIDPKKSIRIGTADASDIRRVTMVKSGSNTHSVDMDQRFLELPFTMSGGDLLAQLPSNPFLTPPGFYLVFVLDSNGVPSVASPIRINPIGAPAEETPATLTVTKVVINNDGGSRSASDFRFSVNGAASVAFQSDGSNVLSVPAGTYTVTEPAVAGYVASYSGCNNIVLAAGDSATCTITNDDEATASPATLTVTKVVINNDGGSRSASDFRFSVNGAASVAFESDGSNVLSVPAGTYSVTEPAVAGYVASYSGCSNIVLAAGDSATCTITNNDEATASPATLTVTKVVINNDGGSKSASDFRFSVNGAASVAFESDSSNVLSVPAGTYSVTEPAVAGYVASYSGCSNIVLAAGDSATCTITNNDDAAGPPPQNLLVNGDFEAGSTGWGTNSPWSIAGGQATKTATAGGNVYQEFAFESGATYQVTYTVVSISGGSINARFINGTGANVFGTSRSATGTYTQQLVAGDHTRFAINAPTGTAAVIDNVVMVKITGNDQPASTLTVRKVVINDDGGSRSASDFRFSVNGAASVAFETDGSNVLSVPAGTYTVTEPAVAGYVASYSSCSNIVLAAGDSATCTITNNDEATASPATLTVTKVVVNDDGGSKAASDFRFSVNGATSVAFESDGSNVLSVPAGTYSVTEPAVAGYVASYSGCSNIVLAAGDSATCTITNNDDAAGPAPQNLLLNGDFQAGSTGWGTNSPWSIAGGQATKTSTAGGNVYQEFAFESGATYQVTYTVVSISGSSINARFINGTGANVFGTNRNAPGTYTQQLVAGDHTRFAINAPIGTAAVIDNVVMVRTTW